jgi:serine/threonine protein kinase
LHYVTPNIYRVFFDLVARCLEIDPKNRISAKQALEHDFFRHMLLTIRAPSVYFSFLSCHFSFLAQFFLMFSFRLPAKNTPRTAAASGLVAGTPTPVVMTPMACL